MNKTKFLVVAAKTGIALNALLLLTLTGCGGNADAPTSGVQVEAPAVAQTPPPPADLQVQSPVVVAALAPAVEVQDDYVYYPSYGVYYSSGRHQYASLQGGAWVSEPAPRGVAVGVLRASPSVKMDFHDAPANHHTAIAQQYPKNWKPSGRN
jgi:hypothetical protein